MRADGRAGTSHPQKPGRVCMRVLGDTGHPLLSFQDFSNKKLAKSSRQPPLGISYSDGPNWERGFATSSRGAGPSPRLIFSSLMHGREGSGGGKESKRATISNRPQTVNDNEPGAPYRSLTALRKRGGPGEGQGRGVFNYQKEK